MRFSVLGPLAVHADEGEALPVAAARQRTVLAALLMRANRAVSQDQLIETVWDGRPPDSARVSLVNYVARLRRALGPQGGARVQTQPGGYLITVHGGGEFDCLRLADLEQEAAAAARAGDWRRVGSLAGDALALWRGEPFQDVPSALLLREEGPALAAMRLRAQELGIEADLHLGDYERAVTQLQPLVRRNQLRERLYEQMIVAQYGAGRRAEALETYQQARRVLRLELGVDPTRELQWLHQRILEAAPVAELVRGLSVGAEGPSARTTQDTTTLDVVSQDSASQVAAPETVAANAIAAKAPVAREPGPVVPRQLPGSSRHFSGRTRELDRLAAVLDPAGATGTAAAIAVITGTAGVGKTTLAVHWSRQVADRFPDGQLYLNLRGFDPGGGPVTPEHAVRGLLEALDVQPARMPTTIEAQTGLYRSLVADKRMLILLDNARDTEQVRPLLPGSPSCPVLITSRNRLAGLAAVEGAQPVVLGLPTDAEALDLLTRRLGAGRIAREEPSAVSELIDMCARLPLALALAAGRLAMNPDFPFKELADRLRDPELRLSTLAEGDDATNVRAVFSWSYRQLGAPAARMFRLLGLHPGPDFSLPAAASLAGLAPDRARAALDELAGAQLLIEYLPGRFTFHDLLRVYAVELAGTHDDDEQRNAAQTRLFDHCLHSAVQADRLLNPNRDHVDLSPVQPGTLVEDAADLPQAIAWFKSEHQVLLAAIAQAGRTGFARQAWHIAWAMAGFLHMNAYWSDWMATQRAALAAAQSLADLDAQARAHRSLGLALFRLDQHEEALTHLRRAVEVHAELGYVPGEASAHETLAVFYDRRGQYREALDHSVRARALYELVGHRPGEASALNAIGWFHCLLGEYAEALDYCGQALQLQQVLEDRHSQGNLRDSLGYIHHQLGEYDQAIANFQLAIELFREFSERYYLADTLSHLGDARQAAGDPGAARDSWKEALVIFEEMGHSDLAALRGKLAG